MNTNSPMSNIPPVGPPNGMMPGGGPSKFKPIDPLRVLRANWLWIATALPLGLVIGGGTWFALNKYAAQFTSEARFNVEASSTDIDNAGASISTPVKMTELEPLILREVQAIKSEPILRQILNKPVVQETKWFEQFNNNMDDAFTALDEDVIKASHIRETPLFLVKATTKSEEDSQTILRALNAEYIRLKEIQVDQDSEQAMRAAQSRRDDAEQRIASIRVQITRFLETNPIDSINGNSSEAELRVRQLIVEQERLKQSLISLQATYSQLIQRQEQNNFDPSDEEHAQIESTNEIFSIDAQLRGLRVQRQLLLGKFKEQHESVKALDLQILALERERKTEYDSQARIVFNAKLEAAANGVEILSQETLKTNESLVEWTTRRQDYVRLLQDYDSLLREQKQAEQDRDESTQMIAKLELYEENEGRTIVDEIMAPQKAKLSFPPSPAVMTTGVGLLFTALVTGLLFLRELLDQRVRSAQDVKMIPDASLIGMIPNANQDRDAKRVERVVEQQPSGLLAESFRQARTAVLAKIDRRGYKTLMMVSAKPGSGVTSSAQNLAVSCARSSKRVLLIDANFRRPGLAKLMSLANQPGLTEALTKNNPIDEVASLIQESDVQGLSLLPTGDTNHAAVELFESQRFRDLLAKLESDYDLIIIDAPPCFLTSDAQLLSRHIDAMLLVSLAKSDTRGMLQRLYRELDGQRADILGVLLNGVEASVGGYMKRNFREFHEYSGPERRSSDRKQRSPSNGATSIKTPAPITSDLNIGTPDDTGDIDLDGPNRPDH